MLYLNETEAEEQLKTQRDGENCKNAHKKVGNVADRGVE